MATNNQIRVPTPQAHLDAFAELDKANAGTPSKIQKEVTPEVPAPITPKSKELTFEAPKPSTVIEDYEKAKAAEKATREREREDIKEPTPIVNAPVSTPTPVSTPAPVTTDREIRKERRAVEEEYSPVFNALDNIGVLAAEGRTAEIDLATSQAADLVALLDAQLKQFEEIKLRKDLSTEELAANEKERELVARDKMLAQNALAQAEAKAAYKNQELQRIEYNKAQQVRLETFAGIKGGFGSSARIANLETVMNQGQQALESIRVDAINSDAKFANSALNIEKDYNLAIGTINANQNAQLLANEDNLMIAVQKINQNKLLTIQERDNKKQEAINKYNDKIEENELRTMDALMQQNAEVQNRINTLKSDKLTAWQVERDEKWQQANFDFIKEQYSTDLAQKEFENQRSIWEFEKNFKLNEQSFEQNVTEFGMTYAIQQQNMSLALKEYEQSVIKANKDFLLASRGATETERRNLEAERLNQLQIDNNKIQNEIDNNFTDTKLMLDAGELDLKAREANTDKNTGLNSFNYADVIANPYSTFKLDDIKDENVKAQTSAILAGRVGAAMESGDTLSAIYSSKAYDGKVPAEVVKGFENIQMSVGITDNLVEIFNSEWVQNLEDDDTDLSPIMGWLKGINPWDTEAQTIKSALTQLVPKIARGVFGEVGVLTDTDIENYKKTLPNLTQTEDVKRAVSLLLLDTLEGAYEKKLFNNIAAKNDMSGFANQYTNTLGQIQDMREKLMSELPEWVSEGFEDNATIDTFFNDITSKYIDYDVPNNIVPSATLA